MSTKATLRIVLFCASTIFVICARQSWAADDWQPIARHLPPAGIDISAGARQKLTEELERLDERRKELGSDKELSTVNAALLVDVDIYLKAVRFALEESEFFKPQDVIAAGQLLTTAGKRLDGLASGIPGWTNRRGNIVRGYRSRVDGSVQPYGLVIPAELDLSKPVPLYVWLHGRNDKLADLQFIAERSEKAGQIAPDDAIVLHPFGRSCLGWKSTAEIDVFEAIDSVCERYPIDRDRVVLMGFSMGGAGAWHIGAHYADQFAAVHAGAGFVDVKRYQKLSPGEYPPEYEQQMWALYDVPKYVRNLFNLPVVAYSGEVDKQKDAADFMAEAFHAEGHELVHLIGPKMPHKYDPAVLAQVMELMHEAAVEGRDTKRPEITLQTRTLRYNRQHWVEALALEEHWHDSRLDASYEGDEFLAVETSNIQSLRMDPPLPVKNLVIDGQLFRTGPPPLTLSKLNGRWKFDSEEDAKQLRKRPGLQGPIDDVLLEPFLVVIPTEKSTPQIDRWVEFEIEHFRRRWKNVYRAELPVVHDVDIKPADYETHHLICWGDPASNAILRKVAMELPIAWRNSELAFGSHRYDAEYHVPLVIYPNPLNPTKYLVLNSGPTHREAHDRTNSLQNPKLGDWAIVDIRTAPDSSRPGKIVAAGCFNEQWRLPDQMSSAEAESREEK